MKNEPPSIPARHLTGTLVPLRRSSPTSRGMALPVPRSMILALRALTVLLPTTPLDPSSLAESPPTTAPPSASSALRSGPPGTNQIIRIRKSYFRHVTRERIESIIPVDETLEGVHVQGQGKLSGRVHVELIPDATRGNLRLTFDGICDTPLVARRRPATIYAHGTTRISASETVYVTPEAVRHGPPRVSVANELALRGVALDFRSRLVRRLAARPAQRIAARQLATANPQVAEHAKRELSAQLKSGSELLVDQVNGLYRRFYWNPLIACDVQPQVTVQTTADEFLWSAAHASETSPAQPVSLPETVADDADIQVFLHQSALNDTNRFYAGRRIDEETLHQIVLDGFGIASDEFQALPSGREPVLLTLADDDPVRFEFDDDRVVITLRVQSLETSEATSWDDPKTIRVAYRTQLTTVGVEAVREHAMEELADAEPAMDAVQMSQIARLFPSIARMPSLVAKGQVGGDLEIRHVTVDQGWFVVGMSCTIASPPPSFAQIDRS